MPVKHFIVSGTLAETPKTSITEDGTPCAMLSVVADEETYTFHAYLDALRERTAELTAGDSVTVSGTIHPDKAHGYILAVSEILRG